MNNRPSLIKSMAATALSAAAAWWLSGLPIGSGTPDGLDPQLVADWWTSIDTATAVMTIVRSIGVATAAYISLVGMVGALLQISGNLSLIATIWRAVSTKSLRHVLAGGAIAIWSVSPSLVAADDSVPDPIVLVDLGPSSDAEAAEITAAPQPYETPADAAPSDRDTWTVAPGDHLWGIAQNVLRADGPEPTQRATNAYWRRLISDNLSEVGANPDLIHPGQVLSLPQR